MRNYQAGDYTSAATGAERYLKDYPELAGGGLRPLSCRRMPTTCRFRIFRAIRKRRPRRSRRSRRSWRNIPKSEYVDDAKYKIQVTEDQLAGKEMSIGRFYLNRHNYTAAINRFRNVLQYYQTTRHAPEALYRLVEAYLGLGITGEAQTAAAVLGHNFPDSQWYKDAYNLSEGQGAVAARLWRLVDLEDLAHGCAVLIEAA